MKWLRLTVSLAACVPSFTLLGMCAAWDSFFTVWGGAGIGSVLGVFFGMAFGGVLPCCIADWCFGPEQPDVR